MIHKKVILFCLCLKSVSFLNAQSALEFQYPSKVETVYPIHKKSFDNDGECKTRILNPTKPSISNGYLVIDGFKNGDQQVDPQIAIGGNYVMEATNDGLQIFDKKGNSLSSVNQTCFNDGIDPKLVFDIHNKIFMFDLWWYYDKAKLKPVNIAVSENNNPLGAWNVYPVSRPDAEDGGGLGYSKKWFAYNYPGGKENTFVIKTNEMKLGLPAKVYHFDGDLGHPIIMQDNIEDLYFFQILEDGFFEIKKIVADANGDPVCKTICKTKHNLKYINYPPESPQKGSKNKISSGDRNPKNVIFQNGFIWFSHTVNYKNKAAVQWHQINANTGKIVQTGLIKSDTSSFMQTTIAVNKKMDVLIGFQEVNQNMYVSARLAYRKATFPKGKTSVINKFAEGESAVKGGAWGDYSGSAIDGDNLLDLWTIQSVANKNGEANTKIVKVPFK